MKPSFIKQVGHHGLKAFRTHLSVFTQLVHVHSVFYLVQNCLNFSVRWIFANFPYLDICSETRKADEYFICDFEDFWEIGGNCVQLLTVSIIRSNTDAVVARHADNRAPVVLKSHSERVFFFRFLMEFR